MASHQRNARPRRSAVYRYGCRPQRGDAIRELAARWGYDLDTVEREERERAFAQLRAEADDDQPEPAWRTI
jgi:hypothetical protein